MIEKSNSFDVLRLLLALCVVFAHALFLGNFNIPDYLTVFSKGQYNLADFGVVGFFSLSGFLISASINNSNSYFKFIVNRVLRIFPAFWVCLLVTAFIFYPTILFFQNNNGFISNFLDEEGSVKYFTSNFFLKINQWSIKDALNNVNYKGSFNGSLWSLFPELQCYFIVITFYFFDLFRNGKIAIVIITLYISLIYVLNNVLNFKYGPSLLVLNSHLNIYLAFLGGVIVYVFSKKYDFNIKNTILLSLLTIFLLRNGGFNLISPLLIPFFLISLFSRFNFRLKYDLSYGIYIYSFPIQQMFISIFDNKLDFVSYFLATTFLTIFFSFLSCIYVEQPISKLKNKLTFY